MAVRQCAGTCGRLTRTYFDEPVEGSVLRAGKGMCASCRLKTDPDYHQRRNTAERARRAKRRDGIGPDGTDVALEPVAVEPGLAKFMEQRRKRLEGSR